MKKIYLFIILFIIGYSANAQYSSLGSNLILIQSEQYITNSPTSTVGNRTNMLILKDSTRWENRWRGIYFTKYTSAKNDGAPSNILWTGSDGALKASPVSELQVGWTQIGGKPSFFSGAYSDLSGKPNLFSGDYVDLTNKPTLFSGSYNDLTNKPTIPAAQVNSDWTSTSGASQILNKPTLFSGAYADLSGKPTLFSGSYNDLTNKPALFSGAYADLTGKPSLFSGAYNDLTGKPTLFSGSYTDLTNKPTIPNVVADYTVTRTINSSTYTISSTRDAEVKYNIKISCTATIGSASTGKVLFQYSINSGSTWIDAGEVENSNTVTLAVALNSVTTQTGFIVWRVPANALCRLVPTTSGTTTITWVRDKRHINKY